MVTLAPSAASARDGQSDTCRRPGNECGFTIELKVHLSSSFVCCLSLAGAKPRDYG